jgi:hypothetical protein
VLEPWEREWAGHVGTKRHEANIGKRDAAYYRPELMEDNLRASIASACAEMAVAKRLNKYWDGSFWTAEEHSRFADRADVGANTEVRRTRKPDGALVVRKRDSDRGRIMVLAYAVPDDFMAVEVIGYAYASEVWERGEPAHYDPSGLTRLVSQRMLYAL